MRQFFKFTFASALGFLMSLFALGFIAVFVVIGLVTMSSPQEAILKPNSILHLHMGGVLQERSDNNPFYGLFNDYDVKQMGLDEILTAIDRAVSNDNIRGIYLQAGGLVAGSASVEEIRNALIRFSESGKFIIAYGNVITQEEYYLATTADKIIINPVGNLDFRGKTAHYTFYKGTMDKLGVEMQIFKVGTFKSAVEPYMLNQMSDASRQQTSSYLNSIWSHMLESISETRNLTIEELNRLANQNQLLQPANEYLKNNLVDALMYRSEVDSLLKSMVDQKQDEELNLVTTAEMNSVASKKSVAKDKIAVLYAYGELDGANRSEGIHSGKLCDEIRKIKEDDDIKAVVLRINSPGGSAFGAEQIWHEVTQLKENKPVVVSMGDYAASGGYYIACAANHIIAQPNTLTGSIGIFGMIPNAGGLTQKLGLTFDEVSTNENSGFPALSRPMTQTERQMMQNTVDRGYKLFLERCADGRSVALEEIEAVAEGRVWSGNQALGNGLIDDLGGINDAVEHAARLADVVSYSRVNYPKKKEFVDMLIEEFTGNLHARLAKSILGDEYAVYETLQKVKQVQGIQARMPYEVRID